MTSSNISVISDGTTETSFFNLSSSTSTLEFNNNQTYIILATTLPPVFVIGLVALSIFYRYKRRRRKKFVVNKNMQWMQENNRGRYLPRKLFLPFEIKMFWLLRNCSLFLAIILQRFLKSFCLFFYFAYRTKINANNMS